MLMSPISVGADLHSIAVHDFMRKVREHFSDWHQNYRACTHFHEKGKVSLSIEDENEKVVAITKLTKAVRLGKITYFD